mgnify:CR=1 FL=1
MLDLKKLEEKLDEALANETAESLTSWLTEKRFRMFMKSLGDGVLEKIQVVEQNSVVTSSSNRVKGGGVMSPSSDCDYSIAA